MHKKHQKVLQRGLSFLYVTHRHDLFYITVKYQNIPNCYRVDTKMFTDGQTDDGRMPGSSLFPLNLSVEGIKRDKNS